MTDRTDGSVLLLNPPGDRLYIRDYYCSFSSKADYYWPPQDLIALSGIVSQRHEVRVLDAIINKLSEQTCRERILAADHSAIIFTTGTATLKTDMELLRTLKAQRRGITVIASAGIMKFIGRELLRGHQFLDAVLTDYSSPDILAYLRGEREAPLRGLM
jgi:hypothetical protein